MSESNGKLASPDLFQLDVMDRIMLSFLLPKQGPTREMLLVGVLMEHLLNFTDDEKKKYDLTFLPNGGIAYDTRNPPSYRDKRKFLIKSRGREVIRNILDKRGKAEGDAGLPYQAAPLCKIFGVAMPEQDDSDLVQMVVEEGSAE